MANSFSCVFHGLILNEILHGTAFPLRPHFHTLTFSQVWSWELPSSKSTMVLLDHHPLGLVYNPSSVKVYAAQWCYAFYSHLPFHKPPATLPVSPDIGFRLGLYLICPDVTLQYLCRWLIQHVGTHNSYIFWSKLCYYHHYQISYWSCLLWLPCWRFIYLHPVELSLKYWFLLPSRISILPLVKLLNSF